MRSHSLWAIALLMAACNEQATETASTPAPAPVAPVEVTPATATPDETAQLRARIAELEQQVATLQGQPQATPIPTGADVPATTPTEVAANDTPAPTTAPAGGEQPAATGTTPARRQRRDANGNLIDDLLGTGPNDRRGNDDEPLRLPNPAEILLGNGSGSGSGARQ